MPTYQYACTACGEQLEVVQSFSDAALTECPACQGALRKVFSAVGVVFKGSGFYKTDSRSGEKKASSSDTSTAGASTSGAATTEAAKSAAPKADSPTSGTSAAKSSSTSSTTSSPAA